MFIALTIGHFPRTFDNVLVGLTILSISKCFQFENRWQRTQDVLLSSSNYSQEGYTGSS